MIQIIEDRDVMGLKSRSISREETLMTSTYALIKAFVTDGDTLAEAKIKVKAFSQDITARTSGVKYDFVLGDTQPLVDSVNASGLADMTPAKKLVVTNVLNQAV